jgi:hypothetical protein
MIFETYTCSMEKCMIEYGFTFKENEETEDTLFDMVLGTIKAEGDFHARIENAWKENEKYARAVCDTGDPKKV